MAILESLLQRPLLFVIIISFLVSLLITLITKFTTNQSELKRIRDEIKEIQKKSKEAVASGNKQKIMEHQSRQMQLMGDQMRHSLRSTFITLIPAMLIFSWMGSVVALEPIQPNTNFNVTVNLEKNINASVELKVPKEIEVVHKETIDNSIVWTLKGTIGDHRLDFSTNTEEFKEVLITTDNEYIRPSKTKKGFLGFGSSDKYISKESSIKSIIVKHEPKKILNLFGWRLGWLGTYIIFSIIFAMLFRKFMKVY